MISLFNLSEYSSYMGFMTIDELIDDAVKFNKRVVCLMDYHTAGGIYQFITKAQKNNLIPVPGAFIKYESGDIPVIAKNNHGLTNLYKLLYLSEEKELTEDDLFQYKEDLYFIQINRNKTMHNNRFINIVDIPKKVIESTWALENVYDLFIGKAFLNQQKAFEHHLIGQTKLTMNTLDILIGGPRLNLNPNHSLDNLSKLFPESKLNDIEIAKHVINFKFDFSYNPNLRPHFKKADDKIAFLKEKLNQGWTTKRKGTDKAKESLERVKHELDTIIGNDYLDYLLIVYDYVKWANENAFGTGAGRGSCGGSEIAYLLDIHRTDPLQFGLIFERFLNPGRGSLYSVNGKEVPMSEQYILKDNTNKYAWQLKKNDILLDNTKIDEIKLIKPSASSIDVDTDFHTEGRYLVFDYMKKTYGENKAANIITFATYAAKECLKAVARAQNVENFFVNELTKPIPDKGVTFKEFCETGSNRSELEDFINKQIIPKTPGITIKSGKEFIDIALELEGRKTRIGVHACGMIVSDNNLLDNIPVVHTIRNNEPIIITGWEYHDCEAIGLIKMDFLGLETVDLIEETTELIEKKYNKKLNWAPIIKNLNDPRVYETFQKANTTGIFQYGSDGVKEFLKELQPHNFDDIMAVTALYRPGPMGMNAHVEFAKKKNGEMEAYPFNMKELVGSTIDDVLKSTYSIMAYQESLMRLGSECAGFSLVETDLLRKATAKKIPSLLAELKPKLFTGMKEKVRWHNDPNKRMTDDMLNKMWEQIEGFAEYSFNKSHSASYAINAYQAAFLRTYFPNEFLSVLINKKRKDKEYLEKLLYEIKVFENIKIYPIDINKSDYKTVPYKDGIILGLNIIPKLSEEELKTIIQIRQSGFENIEAFISKTTITKSFLETLANSGALDSLAGRKFILENSKELLKIRKSKNTLSLFDDDDFEIFSTKQKNQTYPFAILKQQEFELFNFYINGSPLDKLNSLFNIGNSSIAIDETLESAYPSGTFLQVCCLSKIDIKKDRNGSPKISLVLKTKNETIFPILSKELKNIILENPTEFEKGKVFLAEFKYQSFMNKFRLENLSIPEELVDINKDLGFIKELV